MTDAIDRFRHWMIRKLSCGDMMILNAHIRSDGKFIPRNLGPAIIAEAEIDLVGGECALSMGRANRVRKAKTSRVRHDHLSQRLIQSASIPQEKP